MATPITLKEIATKADVSEMTVSKVLSGRYQPTQKRAVARATRIRQLAVKMGYRPNAAAKAIRSGRFGAIALLMSVKPYRGTLFQDMLFAIHDELAENDMKLTMARMNDEQLVDDSKLPKLLNEWCCDGMLVNYTDNVPQRMRDLISAHHLPAIWVNTLLDYDCVMLADIPGAVAATEALIQVGHKRIAFVDYTHGPDAVDPHYSANARLEGYRQAMQSAGLPRQKIFPIHGHHMPKEQRVQACCKWLSAPDRPTAVVVYGGEEVYPILYAAQNVGIHIPNDLSIVTFGENIIELFGPRIAMMKLPTQLLGQRAVSMLLQKVSEPDRIFPSEQLPLTLDRGNTIVPPDGTDGACQVLR